MAYLVYDKKALDQAGIPYTETIYVLQHSDVVQVFGGTEEQDAEAAWETLSEEKRAEYLHVAEKALETIDWVERIQIGFDLAELPYAKPDDIDEAFNVNYSDRWAEDGDGEE